MENKSCCFTGHRNIAKKDYEQIFNVTKSIIEILIKEKNILNFKAGGAKGFDTIASLSIIELKKSIKIEDLFQFYLVKINTLTGVKKIDGYIIQYCKMLIKLFIYTKNIQKVVCQKEMINFQKIVSIVYVI